MLSFMERPNGVTILACVYFFVAVSVLFVLFPSPSFDPAEHPNLLYQSVANLVIALTLGIALLRMKNWSRWVAIFFSVAQLLFLPYVVTRTHTAVAFTRAGLGALFALWVIWYLTRPQIKKAFHVG